MSYPSTNKYPKKWTEPSAMRTNDIHKPRFEFDSRGRLILPLAPYQRMVLSTSPGSRDIKLGSEDSEGYPQITPEALKTGSLHAETVITAGDLNGWVMQIAGGSCDYPLIYRNLSTGEAKFYLDKDGNVAISGFLQVGEAADDINSGTTLIKPGKVLISSSATLADWRHPSDATYIDGGRIYTGSVTLSQLSFTPLVSADDPGDIIATINASSEGIKINASLIQIGGTTVFSSDWTSANNVGDLASKNKVSANDCDTTIISGGKIITNLLTADNIKTGTLTGLIVQTAEEGQRVVLDTSDKVIKFYDSDGDYSGYLSGVSGAIKSDKDIVSAQSLALGLGHALAWGGVNAMSIFSSNTAEIRVYKHLVPRVNPDLTLGSTDGRWHGIYLEENIYFDEANRNIVRGDSDCLSFRSSDILSYVNLNMDNHSISNVDNLYVNDIYNGSTRIANLSGGNMDLYRYLGLYLHSGTPGPASSYKGFVYFDTAQSDIVFSNGTNWYKVTAEQI